MRNCRFKGCEANLSQSEVHYVLHMVERRLNSFMRDDGGGGFSDED